MGCELKMKFQAKGLSYMDMNVPLARGFEISLAALHLICPRRQEEECESAIVVGADRFRFRTVFVGEVKNDARKNRSRRVQSHACDCAGGGCLAAGQSGKRQGKGEQPEEVRRGRQSHA